MPPYPTIAFVLPEIVEDWYYRPFFGHTPPSAFADNSSWLGRSYLSLRILKFALR